MRSHTFDDALLDDPSVFPVVGSQIPQNVLCALRLACARLSTDHHTLTARRSLLALCAQCSLRPCLRLCTRCRRCSGCDVCSLSGDGSAHVSVRLVAQCEHVRRASAQALAPVGAHGLGGVERGDLLVGVHCHQDVRYVRLWGHK